MFNRVLCLGAHTDDCEFGCGGTITKFIECGKDVYYATFSFAEESLPVGFSKDSIKAEVIKAAGTLGVKKENIRSFDYDVRMFFKHRQEILEDLVKLNKEIQPDLVLTHNTNDTHQDHEVISKETFRAFKQTSSIFGCESLKNNAEFSSDVYISLDSEQVRKKLLAIKSYKSQMVKESRLFSVVKGLASLRGMQIKSNYAECFEIIRLIVR